MSFVADDPSLTLPEVARCDETISTTALPAQATRNKLRRPDTPTPASRREGDAQKAVELLRASGEVACSTARRGHVLLQFACSRKHREAVREFGGISEPSLTLRVGESRA